MSRLHPSKDFYVGFLPYVGVVTEHLFTGTSAQLLTGST